MRNRNHGLSEKEMELVKYLMATAKQHRGYSEQIEASVCRNN